MKLAGRSDLEINTQAVPTNRNVSIYYSLRVLLKIQTRTPETGYMPALGLHTRLLCVEA